MKIRVSRQHPDGLDPVRDAYRCLCRIFDVAEAVEKQVGEDEWDVMLRLPGSGELVDTNDLNPLNGLEKWLFEQYDKAAE